MCAAFECSHGSDLAASCRQVAGWFQPAQHMQEAFPSYRSTPCSSIYISSTS